MDYGDYYLGLYMGYYRDPFPHSLLSTRESWGLQSFTHNPTSRNLVLASMAVRTIIWAASISVYSVVTLVT